MVAIGGNNNEVWFSPSIYYIVKAAKSSLCWEEIIIFSWKKWKLEEDEKSENGGFNEKWS